MATFAWPCNSIPSSTEPTTKVVGPALHAPCGSACPVIVNPFSSSVTLGAPMLMQGAPVTVHVTSPASWLSSLIVMVAEIVPLIFAAVAVPTMSRNPRTAQANDDDALNRFMASSLLLIRGSILGRVRREYISHAHKCNKNIKSTFTYLSISLGQH